MAKRHVKITFSVILLKLIIAFGADTTEDLQDKESESFKNLPTLIEYVLDMLERRPEVLETDDLNVFKRHLIDDCETNPETCSSTDTRYKRAPHKYDTPDNSQIKHLNGYNHHIDVKKNGGEDWDSSDIFFKRTTDENNGATNLESINNAKEETESEINLEYDEIYGADDNLDASKATRSLLSPEEVEEQILKVDQMIEDYNSKENND